MEKSRRKKILLAILIPSIVLGIAALIILPKLGDIKRSVHLSSSRREILACINGKQYLAAYEEYRSLGFDAYFSKDILQMGDYAKLLDKISRHTQKLEPYWQDEIFQIMLDSDDYENITDKNVKSFAKSFNEKYKEYYDHNLKGKEEICYYFIIEDMDPKSGNPGTIREMTYKEIEEARTRFADKITELKKEKEKEELRIQKARQKSAAEKREKEIQKWERIRREIRSAGFSKKSSKKSADYDEPVYDSPYQMYEYNKDLFDDIYDAIDYWEDEYGDW